jgi:pantoate--beta-alanine ligase
LKSKTSRMILFKSAFMLSDYLEKQRKNGKTTGFVPTMGALHEGHLDLLRAASSANDLSVVSIFVNPTQFNDPKDFEKYPITVEKDIEQLESAGCDILFLPGISEIYPGGIENQPNYALGYLETILEGSYRPGHFQGVCMVVHRLLNIVMPHNLYMGQKDYQQCMVIARLIELAGFQDNIHLNIVPTRREPGGLAMSSRNMRLTPEEKALAASLYQALTHLKDTIQEGPLTPAKKNAVAFLQQKGFRVDYVEIAGAEDLDIKNEWNGRDKLVALVAAYLNEVRLIDNLLLN